MSTPTLGARLPSLAIPFSLIRASWTAGAGASHAIGPVVSDACTAVLVGAAPPGFAPTPESL